MSEVPSDSATSGQAGQEQYQPEQPVKTIMFYQDPLSGQWFLLPYFHDFFGGLQGVLAELYEIVNQKWTEEQKNCYIRFLTDLNTYITSYIFTGQVAYWEDYQMWIDYVKATGNPIGFELYEKQLDYFQKKMNGYDFKLDKKKGKEGNQPKQEQQQKKREPVEEK